MRKTLFVWATLAASGTAMAQSNFTLYGVADAALERVKGGTNSVNRLASGQWNGSRWGLRGSEDLGSGLKAVFVLESGFNIDTGTSGQGGALFGRQAFVGLGGGFGVVRLGRQYTPTDDVASLVGTKTYDVLSVARIMGVENNDRLNNTVTYVSPSMGGLELQVQYSLGNEGANAAAPNLAKSFNVGGVYKAGPLSLGAGLIRVTDNDAALAGNQKRQGVLLVGGYDFGMAKLTGYFGTQDQSVERLKIFGGVVGMPFGQATVSVGAAKVKNASGLAASDDATIFTLQGKYDLSKRTALYSSLTAVSNKGAAALGFNTPAAGKNSNGLQVGIKHSF